VPQRRISQTEAGTKTWAIGGEDKKCWAWCFACDPSSHSFNSPIGVDLDTPKLFSHAPPLITPPPRVLREWWCVFSQFSHKRWKMGPPDRKTKSPSIFRIKGSRCAPYFHEAPDVKNHPKKCRALQRAADFTMPQARAAPRRQALLMSIPRATAQDLAQHSMLHHPLHSVVCCTARACPQRPEGTPTTSPKRRRSPMESK
jgi:hypothetical protein